MPVTTWVYITQGIGTKYHTIRGCESLKEGQDMVALPTPVKTVKIEDAVALGKNPCKGCRPKPANS
jgi:hypothetical protein